MHDLATGIGWDVPVTPTGQSSATGHPSELELHRVALGQLPPDRQASVEAHAGDCPLCADALASLRLAHQAFEGDVHARTAGALVARAGRGGPRRRSAWLWLLGAPAAAVVLIVGWGALRGTGVLGPDLRAKGPGGGQAVGLEVFARRGDQVFAVSAQTPLQQGDAIRFVVRKPAELDQLLVVGVQAAGAVTVYHPFAGATSVALDARAGRLEVEGSVVLDDRTGPERVFALLGRAPIALDSVRAALAGLAAGGAAAVRATAHLDVPADGQASVLLERTSP
jgi:hypothetical protein